ncbi:L-type lectin-domain containing receptor kinase IX.1-like [Aegilops tauschii subsp. strangulata]|uniref:L-type lectin-domain containing receptor kinase IX.1-like n=1 Tax=Aegilops tauschii subsp. strangulata TaxID=200361 RepID=UPI00098A28F1
MYHELVAATSNFAKEEKLGRGGFRSVYRGHLTLTPAAAVGSDQDRREVAVKVLSVESSAQGRKEFEAEVRIISRLKHRNLVQLLGWCDSRKGLLLVYELVAESSLDRHLYSKDGTYLTWPQRYNIILGLGSALRYLHVEWEQCIVHGDIKPSNIMLDLSLSTKLGDFGLARLIDHGAGSMQTTKAVLGTVGYIDPEFVNTRRPSTKSDVYSFGVVLLEITSGRRPVMETPERSFTLLSWVWGLYGRNAILDAADERLRGDEADARWMERVLIVGLWCAHPDQGERPSIAQALHVLQSDEVRLPVLPPHMYRTVPDPTSSGPYGPFSIDSLGSSCVRSSLVSIGNITHFSESSSTALLQHFKDLGRNELKPEVRIISRQKHRNLIQLLGWYDSYRGLLVVYKFATEGSLDMHLYGKDIRYFDMAIEVEDNPWLGIRGTLPPWEWEQCVVHGDIKPSNIMLDSSMSTKHGDVGLARLFNHDTRLMQTTKAVLSTVGYIYLEFFNTRRPCTELDMYNFSVVLLQIVSGGWLVMETSGKSFTLVRWVWSLYERNTILNVADERLRGEKADERWMARVLVDGL